MANSKSSRRQALKGALLGAAGLAGCSIPLVGGTRQYTSEHFVFNLPDDLSKEAVEYIKEEHELGLKKLEELLRVERDYGRKLGGKITVGVVYSGANISYLFGDRAGSIDYNRGNIGNVVRSGSGPFIHETTHHVVGRAGDFFSEGLAVYTQAKIGRNPAGPNYGADLHRKIADMELMPLSRFIDIQGLSRTLPENEVTLAYLQAGSFVKFLIEDISKGDTKPFMKFYLVDGDYKGNFGKGFEELEQGWREKIKNTKPLYTLSDALKVEHLNPRLEPRIKPDNTRNALIQSESKINLLGGRDPYQIWVDVDLESRAKDVIELTKVYMDNLYNGKWIGGTGNYRIGTSQNSMKRRVAILGRTLTPNEKRRVEDFPIMTSPTWSGTEFVVHYTYKIPKISNEEFDTLVRMKKIWAPLKTQ
jgi:hypothetical protein